MLAAVAVAAPSWHQVPFSYNIRCATLGSNSSGWASGDAGPRLSGFFRYDGSQWSLVDTVRDQLIYDIAISGEEAWAVGEQFNFPDGVVYRWDGVSWDQQADPFDRTLQAVSFPDSSIGFAGGASPSLHHPVMVWRGGEWEIDTTLTTNRIVLGLYATYPGKCVAVGDSGSIFHWQEGGGWVQKRTLTGEHLRRVEFGSNTEGWAVGNSGMILRCFKDTWAIAPSPTTRNLRGLAIAGTSGEAWAVGDSGTILHMVHDSWTLDPFVPGPPDAPLYTVTFSSAIEGWAFGYTLTGAKVALHYCDDSTGIADQVGKEFVDRLYCRPSLLKPGSMVLIEAGSSGQVEVFDSSGRLVRRLGTGPGALHWDGQGLDGRPVPAGCYVVRCGTRASVIVRQR
jgi:hypothetical protein